MAVTVHRVVVRGHFADLTPDQRAALLAEVADHEIFKAAYTEWGTFSYEPNLVAFQFRYEVRTDPDADRAGGADPAATGLARATAQLAEWGIGAKHLRVSATDMSQMWSG